ncbi:hypothetical protein ROZALSC1DRAFT_28993, partial [Rozella allomycis CSF55]
MTTSFMNQKKNPTSESTSAKKTNGQKPPKDGSNATNSSGTNPANRNSTSAGQPKTPMKKTVAMPFASPAQEMQGPLSIGKVAVGGFEIPRTKSAPPVQEESVSGSREEKKSVWADIAKKNLNKEVKVDIKEAEKADDKMQVDEKVVYSEKKFNVPSFEPSSKPVNYEAGMPAYNVPPYMFQGGYYPFGGVYHAPSVEKKSLFKIPTSKKITIIDPNENKEVALKEIAEKSSKPLKIVDPKSNEEVKLVKEKVKEEKKDDSLDDLINKVEKVKIEEAKKVEVKKVEVKKEEKVEIKKVEKKEEIKEDDKMQVDVAETHKAEEQEEASKEETEKK